MGLTDSQIIVYYKNTCSVTDTCLTYTFAPNRKDKNMKVITKLFGTLIKTVLVLLMLALLAPILYFARRANQPMDMPEFKGLTYAQYMDWRTMVIKDIEAQYIQNHPEIKVIPFRMAIWYILTPQREYIENTDGGECYYLHNGIDGLNVVNSALYVLFAHKRPFFSTWWQTFEDRVWTLTEFSASMPYDLCRLPLNVPTPEQYEAMKQERANMPP